MKRQVEIFTAGCPICEPVVALVTEVACEHCEITTYNLSDRGERESGLKKAEEYGVKRLPSVAVDGKLLDCCYDTAITKKDLIDSGIGSL